MATLVLRLAAPLQSWGLSSRFGERDTAREPTKSGVIGLICAALGRDRDADIGDLAAMKFGVLVDRPGELLRDYHTALDVATANGSGRETVLTNRHYLADAAFWAGLEGDGPLLAECEQALGTPKWPIFLGRKACLPGERLRVNGSPFECALRPALISIAASSPTLHDQKRRLVLEDATGGSVRMDQPLATFAQRRFGPRRVREELL